MLMILWKFPKWRKSGRNCYSLIIQLIPDKKTHFFSTWAQNIAETENKMKLRDTLARQTGRKWETKKLHSGNDI